MRQLPNVTQNGAWFEWAYARGVEGPVSIIDLETALRDAQARQSKAIAALAPKHRGGEVEEFNAARTAVLQAERNLAAAKREEYAVPIEFPVRWDTGAPLPYLLQNDYRTFLAFFLHTVDPNWDGAYVNVRNPSSELSEKLALVEFERCVCTKMGTPNDEVLHGHRLYGKGLAGYDTLKEAEAAIARFVAEIEANVPDHMPPAEKKQNRRTIRLQKMTPKIRNMRSERVTIAEIARETGFCEATIHNVTKDMAVDRRRTR